MTGAALPASEPRILPAQRTRAWLRVLVDKLSRNSRAIVSFFDLRMDQLISAWILVVCLAGAAMVAAAPLPPAGAGQAMATMLPYLLVALAPIAGYRIAAGSFPRGQLSAQPAMRLARYGKWRALNVVEARNSPSFGPAGYMASLLVGILLNVPVRTFEFLLSVPALGPNAPAWGQTIFHAMAADVIVMNFFYMVCFVMALRSVPLFPRMLLFAWTMDIVMQFVIAQQVANAPGLPPQVADALIGLLDGNIQKVLISAFVWLPYLLLSDRVNITYRSRRRG